MQYNLYQEFQRPGAMGKPGGSGWRGRWEGGSGWGTHINPWLFHFNVWQNPLQMKKKKRIPNAFFTEIEKNTPKIYVETLKTLNSQRNPKKEEQIRKYHTSWFQIILQVYSNFKSILSASKQTNRAMKQNWETRNKTEYIQSTNIWQRRRVKKLA